MGSGEGISEGGRQERKESRKAKERNRDRQRNSKCWPVMGRAEMSGQVSKEQGVCEAAATAAAKSLQSCPTLCDPRDGSPPGSPIPGILHWSGLPFPSPVHESEI